MGFWGFFLMMVVNIVVGELLRPKPPAQRARPPAGIGDFQFPTATESRPVPVFWGDVKIAGPNVVWYGDLATSPIIRTQKVKGMFKSKTVSQTIGYNYFVGIHFGICLESINELYKIEIGDKVAWTGSQTTDGEIFINEPNLFGGEEKEGGIWGYLKVARGGATQTVDPYLASKLTNVPAYRGLTSFIWQRGAVGTSPYPKPWAFFVRRYPAGLGSGVENINGDANPAEILYELLLNDMWGMGLIGANIDTTSFTNVATQLNTEGFGLSLVWDNQSQVVDVVKDILRYIDGVIYVDPQTGLFTLRLIRDDYVLGNLLVLDESNIIDVDSYSRGSLSETTNEIKGTYLGDNKEERVFAAQDLANRDMQGVVVSAVESYVGITKADLIQKVVVRDLKSSSVPMAKVSFVCNRTAWELRPGDAFKFSWGKLGISELVMRILRIDFGSAEDDEISIEAIQDTFALGTAIFGTPEGSNWVDPSTAPAPALIEMVQEPPFLMQYLEGFTDPLDIYPTFNAIPASGDSTHYNINYQIGTDPYILESYGTGFTPYGTLAIDFPKGITSDTGTNLVVTDVFSMSALETVTDNDIFWGFKNLMMIGDEIIGFRTVVDNRDGTFTLTNLYRGLMDTTPRNHVTGAGVWFLSYGVNRTEAAFAEAQSINFKLTPVTSKGELAVSLATALPITLSGRAQNPYPPGRLHINGAEYPAYITADAVLNWRHRDRDNADQLNQIILQIDNGSYGPPVGTTYTVHIFGEDLVTEIHTEAGLTGTGFTYTQAAELVDSFAPEGNWLIDWTGPTVGVARATGFHVNVDDDTNGYTEKTSETLFETDTDVTTRQTLVRQGDKNNGFHMYIDAGNLYWGVWGDSTASPTFSHFISTSISGNRRYHAAGVFDQPNSEIRLYLDGKEVAQVAVTTTRLPRHTQAAAGIGNEFGASSDVTKMHDGNSSSAGRYFKGNQYWVRQYNDAKPAKQIFNERYSNLVGLSPTNCVQNYDLQDGRLQTTLVDSSVTGLNATFAGTTGGIWTPEFGVRLNDVVRYTVESIVSGRTSTYPATADVEHRGYSLSWDNFWGGP